MVHQRMKKTEEKQMKAIAILLAGFVAIGAIARTFNRRTRLVLILLILSLVLYVTFKYSL